MSVPSSAPSLPPCGLFRRHHEFSSYTNTSPDQLATAAGSLSVPLISVSSFSNEGTTIALGAGNDFDLVASSSSSSVQSPLSPTGIPVRSGQYQALYESFVSTRSRVVQVSILSLVSFLESLHEERHGGFVPRAQPLSMWTTKEHADPDNTWVVFRTHDEARAFLSLSYPSITVLPALEADLELLERFWRTDIGHKVDSYRDHQLRMSLSTPDLHRRATLAQPSSPAFSLPVTHAEDFTLSSNPPNPRTTFRSGDWMSMQFAQLCRSQLWGVRMPTLGKSSYLDASTRVCSIAHDALAFLSSVHRFRQYDVSLRSTVDTSYHFWITLPQRVARSQAYVSFTSRFDQRQVTLAIPPSTYTLWATDTTQSSHGMPLTFCHQQPPILNTGNRGPIEHQPGDWICLKCNYLNWRRRKVCQTCFPYAEGNGDSISAAVQAERIHLLTSLLARNQLSVNPQSSPEMLPKPTVPVQPQRSPVDLSQSLQVPPRPRSQLDLGARYPDSQFIYETSGPALPLRHLRFLAYRAVAHSVPTSTSSAELSIEEYEDNSPSSQRSSLGRDRLVLSDDSISHSPLGNIWKLNDEETKGGAAVALPTHEDLVGSRNSSREF
ncbi:hypothetical protein EDD15DRAFT_2198047 [Pisolithus albus]|nr:hypothetical protein EDD15DRAFT_2198047 [Pisolithus albus]